MDHSWRPPPLPPIPGNNTTNICPICSLSHFPFCLPPPFIENPRFHHSQPQHNYNHQRPHFDPHHPLPNHQIPMNYNYDYNPSDGRRPTLYGSNPRLDPSPYVVESASYAYDGYDNGGIKRMKVELMDNNPRFPSHNERILKLIHDHGNAANATPSGLHKVGLDLSPAFNHERFAESFEVRDEIGLKRRRDNVLYDQRDELGQSQFDRIENSLPRSSDYSRHYTLLGQNQLQTNHSLLSSRVQTDVNRHVEVPHHYALTSFGNNFGQPPLPASPPPPPPPPIDPPRNHFFETRASPPPKKPSLFPVIVSSSADSSSSRSAIHENKSSAHVYYTNNARHHTSTLPSFEELHTPRSSSEKHVRDVQLFPLRHLPLEKPNIVDASHIFKQPHRASRPDHFVIILRGLPGSGKSYLAKVLRDIEVENVGEAPRIHSMDEYFMTEVEKAEDNEMSKSSVSLRGKRQVMKKVMEYCYEPEMEEAYRASMLKAFKKTLDDGVYSFIIVDDRNLRVADFAQFWATAKRSGYEVYIAEASYKDPAGCAARNVHNFTLDDIHKMAGQWEEAPSLYTKLDIKSLIHGDGFDESGIEEVDMDMEDEDPINASQGFDIKIPHDNINDQADVHGSLKATKHPIEEVKYLSRSKWSNDFDGSESVGEEGGKSKASALSGLIQAYSKDGKSVQWGDQGGNVGFSISATRKTNTRSLVIGPGPGYNLKSNPLSEEEYQKSTRNVVEPKSENVFQERIRAERESFKAVFDKRRQRIGGFNVDDE